MIGNYPYKFSAALMIWPTEVVGTWRVKLVSQDDRAPEEYPLQGPLSPEDAKSEALSWAKQHSFDPTTSEWIEIGRSYNDRQEFEEYPSSFCISGTTTSPIGTRDWVPRA